MAARLLKSLHRSNSWTGMSAPGLGCVEKPGERRHKVVEIGEARSFSGLIYAVIAAVSDRTPMMFMTRVRL